jgi:hypothetical protein
MALQEVEVVADRLGRQALALLGQQVVRDEGAVDLVHWPCVEERDEVAAQAAAVVVDRRALALHDVLEVLDVERAGLLDRLARRAGQHDLGAHQPAQLGLGLRPCQTITGRRPTLQPDAPLDPPPADPPGAVPGLPTVAVGPDEQLPGSVGATRHHDHYVARRTGSPSPQLEPYWNHEVH